MIYLQGDASRIFRRRSRILINSRRNLLQASRPPKTDPVHKVDFAQAIMQIVLYVKCSRGATKELTVWIRGGEPVIYQRQIRIGARISSGN